MIELPRHPDGTRHRKMRRARTKVEAQKLLREMRDELASTGSVLDARRTVSEAVGEYRRARQSKNLGSGTLKVDKWQLDLVEEGLGGRRLAELTVGDCDRFLRDCASGLGTRRSVGRAHLGRVRSALVNVLRNEMRIGALPRNVAELSILPSAGETQRDRRALSVEELRALLAASSGVMTVFIDLVGRNALRPAEARALRWGDVDFDAAELSVCGQLSNANEFSAPKTKKAARTVQLDDATLNRLGEWQCGQGEARGKARGAWEELDLVVSTGRGTAMNRHNVARSLRKLSAVCDIDPAITPYELRHTAISMQADAGRSSWEIADWAGTSERMITEVYRHRLRRVSGLRPVDLGRQKN